MIETFTGGGPGRPESNEAIKPTDVTFYKLGGTWDMVFRDGQKIGTGNLDDDALKAIQSKLGVFTTNPKERSIARRKLVRELYKRFQQTAPEKLDVGEHLSSWAKTKDNKEFKDFAHGPFIPLFSGDSSHLDSPVTAPMFCTLVEKIIREPDRPILGGQGTDTADIALLGLFDVFTFDTQLAPLILAGANRSHLEPESDAPGNFVDLARLTHIDLPPGAYWVFQGNLHKASDFVKIDPTETRKVEEQMTFHSPHRTNERIENLLEHGRQANWAAREPIGTDHVLFKVTPEVIYDILGSIFTDDLGNQNDIPGFVMGPIHDSRTKAIIVAAHSLGNVGNETRFDLVTAAKEGKLIIDVSRTLVSDTSEEYAASLVSSNRSPSELQGTGKMIISAYKLNKTLARALATRAILEGRDQLQTQELFTNYARSRKLL